MPIVVPQKRNGPTYVQSAEPSDPKQGQTWYDTESEILKIYDGFKWVETKCGPTGASRGYVLLSLTSADSPTSIIQRIEFPFDSGTARHIGNLSSVKARGGACNSTNYGFSFGGTSNTTQNGLTSIIDRLQFPFEGGTVSQVGNLSTTLIYCAGCNSSQHGFSMGGYRTATYGTISNIERIAFPFDSGSSSHVGNLTDSRDSVSSCNSSEHGFACGGTGIVSSNIERISFPFSSGTASHVGNLTGSGTTSAGCNSSNYGFTMGQLRGSVAVSIVQRIEFPFNSGTARDSGNLTNEIYAGSGMNSTKYGYCSGGRLDSGASRDVVDRFDFPFDTGTSQQVGNLVNPSHYHASCDETDFNRLFI